MSKIIVDSLQANGSLPLRVEGDLTVTGSLTVNHADGLTANAFYGDGSGLTNIPASIFTGNTSGSCMQNLWLEYLSGCNGLLNIAGDVNANGFMSASSFYGDSSNMVKSINNIVPIGSGVTDVNAYLQYGVNIISTATTTDFCVRLPLTPIEGREVIVINNSGFDIFVYPSMVGGTVNGVLNGIALVPSDNNAYTFICYENPNPGQWSGNVILNSGQYDSGVISIDTSVGNGYVSAYDDNYKNTPSQFSSINCYQSLTLPNILYNPNFAACGGSSGTCSVVYFKPVTPWAFIDKVTVYTNFTTGVTAGCTFGLVGGSEQGFYSAGTIDWVDSKFLASGNQGQPAYGAVSDPLLGTPIVTLSGFTATPGEPGTLFGELIYSAATRPYQIGDILLSSGTASVGFPAVPTNVDIYSSRYIGFVIDTNVNSPLVKFRFLIDYSAQTPL